MRKTNLLQLQIPHLSDVELGRCVAKEQDKFRIMKINVFWDEEKFPESNLNCKLQRDTVVHGDI